MKKLIYIPMVIAICIACENQEFDYPDYDYTAVYFPMQYPVRTLVLGEDRVDNSMDQELKFQIGVTIGGLFENRKDWNVEVVLDESLAQGLVNQNGDTLRILPSEYYTLGSNQLVIPSGDFSGFVDVQLNEIFLSDSLATFSNYVIPLRITDTDADSILSGLPVVEAPNKHLSADWDPSALPKDFVLFGIKYINLYHGYYLHRGSDVTFDPDNNQIDEKIYHEKYVERDQVVRLITTGKQGNVTDFVGVNVAGNGKYSMILNFNDNGGIVIDSTKNSDFKVSGTGRFVEDGDEWGGIKQNVIYLNYTYMDGVNRHEVYDTLVYRNNGVSLEENVVTPAGL